MQDDTQHGEPRPDRADWYQRYRPSCHSSTLALRRLHQQATRLEAVARRPHKQGAYQRRCPHRPHSHRPERPPPPLLHLLDDRRSLRWAREQGRFQRPDHRRECRGRRDAVQYLHRLWHDELYDPLSAAESPSPDRPQQRSLSCRRAWHRFPAERPERYVDRRPLRGQLPDARVLHGWKAGSRRGCGVDEDR
jgi:hypothetical protein